MNWCIAISVPQNKIVKIDVAIPTIHQKMHFCHPTIAEINFFVYKADKTLKFDIKHLHC